MSTAAASDPPLAALPSPLRFSKMTGAGNDFIVADNRGGDLDWLRAETVAFLCDRRRGIGADGVMLLQRNTSPDESGPALCEWAWRFFNSDGSAAEMCGARFVLF